MSLTVSPGPIEGTVAAPPSKSYTHRAYVMAALAGQGTVRNALVAGDTEATRNGLAALGARNTLRDAEARFSDRVRPGRAEVDAQNSGTTLRILTAVAALGDGPVTLTGDESLRRRPMGPLLEALGPLGAKVTSQDGRAPVEVRGPLRGGRTRLDAELSSQYLTALLLACPTAPADTTIDLASAPRSRPYVDVTLRVLKAYGIRATVEGARAEVAGGQRPAVRSFDVPGDYSSAAFFLAAAAVTRGRVTVTNLDPNDVQGDRRILEILDDFGCRVVQAADHVVVEGRPLSAVQLDLGRTPDLFPVLCAVAAVAEGRTVLSGAPHLRHKESDRIRAMVENLEAFGIECSERDDGIEIEGGTPKAATIRSAGDHRIAQAGVLMALAADGASRLDDPEVLGVSYPNLLDDLAACGGRFDES